ncbi:MAG: ribose-phosphate diphosphokinase [Elusimicrobiales bacterium]|jgi:ribose-phosphate pyrophosphokinase|nr:ribose-phosphate pyrophosphokinase [Elusimicrobiales bacterium]HOL62949.1 ribose-phosphate pyrophosphokinase [Elusimicrobiales bacterium]HPO94459.1 ribose-phosphate pyrophosphokinase [Elusimicrobiales bacterium]
MRRYWEQGELKIFSGNSNKSLALKISEILGMPLGNIKVARFADGEIDVKILENVRGADCYVVQSTCNPVNENLMELLIMIDAFKRASAGRIIAVIPYFGYARADRKAEPRVPISAKLVADLLTVSGADRVITIDLHAPQIQGFFDIPVDNLYARPVFLDYIKGMDLSNTIVVSPDIGSVDRARSFAKKLDLGLVIVDKRRPKPNMAEVYNIIGSVNGLNCLIFDDMIDTGGTLTSVANAIKKAGAKSIMAFATHSVLSKDAVSKINDSPIDSVVFTDTIPIDLSKCDKFKVVSVSKILAEAIKRNHLRESVSELFD